MRKMSRYLRVAILSLVIFSSFSVTTESLAYWTSGIIGSSSTTTATVTLGDWLGIPQYDANTSYSVGDQVTNNGITYQAKKSGLLKEPGVDGGWKSDWIQL